MKQTISKFHYTMDELFKQRCDGIIIEHTTSYGSIYYYTSCYSDIWYIIDDYDDDYFVSTVKQYRYLGCRKINKKCIEFLSYYNR